MQTLYESWQLRRQLLESKANPIDAAIADAQKQILDYLLKRYLNNAAAALPAAFPARTELKVDRRAIVVHEHVGRGVVAGVKNEVEASGRAARILKRISNLDPQSSVGSPGDGIFPDPLLSMRAPEDERPSVAIALESNAPEEAVPELASGQSQFASITYRQRLAWGRIHSAIKAGDPPQVVLTRIRAALAMNKALPERAVTYLFDQCSNPLERETLAAELMVQCINASVPVYALMAWRDRLAALSGPDDVAEILRTGVKTELMRKSTLAHLRPYLADSHASVRLESAILLSELGTVHDVGLLLDLASLPRQSDEDPSERHVLVNAAEKLANA